MSSGSGMKRSENAADLQKSFSTGQEACNQQQKSEGVYENATEKSKGESLENRPQENPLIADPQSRYRLRKRSMKQGRIAFMQPLQVFRADYDKKF
jgi:hypothetical protein